jgi:hypothetical protein
MGAVIGVSLQLRALGGHHAGFRSSAALWMPERLTIVVPSMGDSISEGTICAVLRQAGEAVEEDEVIAQIETDKVTVDVRAPKMGVIHNVRTHPAPSPSFAFRSPASGIVCIVAACDTSRFWGIF